MNQTQQIQALTKYSGAKKEFEEKTIELLLKLWEQSEICNRIRTQLESQKAETGKENIEKFKQVLLYVVSKVGSRPNIGQTALYKLLYFIDFDYYEKYQQYLIGATYIKNTHGPSPVSFAKIARDLKNQGKLVEVNSKYFNYDQKKYLVTAEPEVSSLSAQELKHIDDELARLASKSAKALSDLSHIDTPWRVAGEKQILNYRHVFYRPDETTVANEYE